MTSATKRTTAGAAAAVLAGITIAVAVAGTHRMPGEDVTVLVAWAGGGAVAAGLLGIALLRAARRAPLAQQALVVALTPVVATGAGASLAARAMFVSSHDLAALSVVLAAAGGIGVAVGLGLAARLAGATRMVATLAERLATEPDVDHGLSPSTRELASLADQLTATSARLAESMARERALDSSRRELVAWVSHDLRTPLAGIRAMVEALEDRLVEGDDVDRYYRTLGAEADRLAGLVDDLFELSRIESSALRLTLERVCLGDVVSDALAGAGPVARAKGVRLDGTVHEPSPMVDAATAELTRVLHNLLDNAIRHTPADGSVVIEAGADEDDAFVTVHDSCGGIPSHEIDRVFDLAFRGDPARTPGDNGGGGLGLAIARGLVEAHDGDLAVVNEGGGCRFTLRLPLR